MNWFLLAFTSAVFSAAASISEKKALLNVGVLEFSFFMSLLGVLFSVPFFFVIDYASLTVVSLGILFVKSIMGALAFFCVMYALKNLEISRALPLLVLTPGFVAFFAFIFLGESLSHLEIIGMVLLLTGTYILEIKSKEELIEPFKVFFKSTAHHYIIFALLLFTATSIMDKLLVGNYKMHPYTYMGFQQLFYAFIFLLLMIFAGKSFRVSTGLIEKSDWILIIIVALLTVGYRYTQIEAVKIAPVALVLSVKRISVFIAAIGGGQIFKEKNLLKKAVATAIMIAGALLILDE